MSEVDFSKVDDMVALDLAAVDAMTHDELEDLLAPLNGGHPKNGCEPAP